ncbi:MAG: DUF1156 domain-containing protein [Pirellulales bacterium]|nr:DUF1156 domain-containing protein [Pirellulales bacterium]
MLKRLIEVALPLKEVSEQSAREKSIRHGHISTLHIWWARRPLAACRAAVFASLIPDPDDPECPDGFRKLVMETLKSEQFRPKSPEADPSSPAPRPAPPVEDTPRGRCLEFIKHLVRWENSNNPEYIVPARALIAAAHKFLHPDAQGDAPKVLDPFAGGGAIPLEALRLGCEAHAIDINPVAHLIELCTLVYPQKYGQPDSRPVPDYIKRLVAHNRAKKKEKGQGRPLFDAQEADEPPPADDEIIPDVEITEAEYRKNPLAADVKYWGYWVLASTRSPLSRFYPVDQDGRKPIAYLWARTVRSPDPTADVSIPLVRQLWVCRKSNRKVALRMTPDPEKGKCLFDVAEGRDIDFDPDKGTMKRGQAECPFTHAVANSRYLQAEGNAGRIGHQLMAVVTISSSRSGRQYRAASDTDLDVYEAASRELADFLKEYGKDVVPTETLMVWSGVFNAPLFGLNRWRDLFNQRQLLALALFQVSLKKATCHIASCHDREYAKAVSTYLGLLISKMTDWISNLTSWQPHVQCPGHVFNRQALPMVWDYAESCPLAGSSGSWESLLSVMLASLQPLRIVDRPASVVRGHAGALPFEIGIHAVVTDPPYYDAVPYSELSDYFYVWLRRSLADIYPDVMRTPLTPKAQELVSHLGTNYPGKRKTAQDYEAGMATAFSETRRVLTADGIATVMFAHKTTGAWESIIASLLKAGLVVTSSWPIHTEMKTRLRGQESAALASSVTLVCRPRRIDPDAGLWDDVRQELRSVAQERLDFFWSQGIRGADFFISAIGPALSVFGKYERVTMLSGDEVSVGQFLDEVRSLVSNYALTKILKTSQTGSIDAESQFYVVWRWSYGTAKVPADEAFKLSQALGLPTERMWDRTGTLEKSGENVQAMPIAKRMKLKDLGDPAPDGSPASLIDVLHRLCVFREKGDTEGMIEFLAQSGQSNNPSLWIVAQAISEILPDGEKEKQLMQGLLNQKEKVEEAGREGRLF